MPAVVDARLVEQPELVVAGEARGKLGQLRRQQSGGFKPLAGLHQVPAHTPAGMGFGIDAEVGTPLRESQIENFAERVDFRSGGQIGVAKSGGALDTANRRAAAAGVAKVLYRAVDAAQEREFPLRTSRVPRLSARGRCARPRATIATRRARHAEVPEHVVWQARHETHLDFLECPTNAPRRTTATAQQRRGLLTGAASSTAVPSAATGDGMDFRAGNGSRARRKPGHFVALQQPVDPHLDARQLAAFFGRDEREGHAFAPMRPVRPTRCT